uniref:Pre-rRNA-processing protein TSR2 homolog n=1 Tax=Chrysotila carterae TaxID=13221 RepID=A0A7S4BXI1_CHRCT|mmetsp:Transcript_5777/g.12628  ORF Transcript_5777/g.12628 Transcript_5777/m.12628 type:complete len:176 (-) Transcript_5777:243-770(-)
MAAETFALAIRGVFASWSALGLAVENEWGGRESREKALALMERITSGLLSSEHVYVDDIESVLDQALLDDFNVEAEDESPRQVAEVLCKLHTEARAGVDETARALLERLAAKRQSSWVEAPLPPKPKREDDSSDEEGEEDEDGDSEMGGGGGGARAPPVVDDDGFQMVTRSRSRR